MRRDEFTYQLPDSLIAQYPAQQRGDSRLLCLDKNTGQVTDRQFRDLLNMVSERDLLVFNNTRVIPARLFGKKETGGKVEIMVERVLGEGRILAQMRFSKTPKYGTAIILENQSRLIVSGIQDDMFILQVDGTEKISSVLEAVGHMPLPPYIQRMDEVTDKERYQTVYARTPGAIAAPTAGLHFSEAIMQELNERNIRTAFVTLHVGAGTFQPVRVEHIEEHRMHSEYLEVSREVCDMVNKTKSGGGRVIAVGTTTVRSLETAALTGTLKPYAGETDIFITPGFDFRVVDALLTNFHLPESTLLMLVCAFGEHKNVLRAYQHAIAQQYRFYSYGDAMFIY